MEDRLVLTRDVRREALNRPLRHEYYFQVGPTHPPTMRTWANTK